MHPRVRRDLPRVSQLDQYGRRVAAFLTRPTFQRCLEPYGRVASRATIGRRSQIASRSPLRRAAPHWCAAIRGKGQRPMSETVPTNRVRFCSGLIGADGLRLAPTAQGCRHWSASRLCRHQLAKRSTTMRILAVFLSGTEQTNIGSSSIIITWAKPNDRLAPAAGPS
jgi:hypothetical protein